jgi:hypothetical protein
MGIKPDGKIGAAFDRGLAEAYVRAGHAEIAHG